jgi:hypothetical protein
MSCKKSRLVHVLAGWCLVVLTSSAIAQVNTTITVTWPQAGSEIDAGASFSVSWWEDRTVQRDLIYIYLCQGTTVVDTLSTNTYNDGSEGLYMPAETPPGTYRLWLVAWPPYNGYSADFTVRKPVYIRIDEPYSGATVTKGRPYTIRYLATGPLGPLTIYLLLGSFKLFDITTTASPDSGYYVWNVPDTMTTANTYRIGVKDPNDTRQGASDVTHEFTIKLPWNVIVTAPDSGAVLTLDSQTTITWDPVESTGDVTIELYKGNTFMGLIRNPASLQEKSTFWFPTAPLLPGTDYRLKFVSTASINVFAWSAYFTIKAKTGIIITAPISSDKYTAGDTCAIQWKSRNTGRGKVNISLLRNDSTLQMITTELPDMGFYQWVVPSGLVASSAYAVCITSLLNEMDFATSDRFYINSMPTGALAHARARVPSVSGAQIGYVRGMPVLTVSSVSGGLACIEVFTASGRRVGAMNPVLSGLSVTSFDIAWSHLPAGTYMVRCRVDGVAVAKRFVVTGR